MSRPFRFGAQVAGVFAADEVTSTARRVEELGYDTLFVPDHVVSVMSSPMPVLAVASTATTRLRVGTLVLDNDFRNPVLLAQEAATLDTLSGGRFELGIGAGWMADDYARTGIPYDRPRVRLDRLEESLHILARLLSGQAVHHDGSHYRVHVDEGLMAPAQEPHLPILVGGGGRRLLEMAGRAADIVQVTPRTIHDHGVDRTDMSPGAMDQKVKWATEQAAADGRDPELSVFVFTAVTGDRQEVAENLAKLIPPLTPEEVLESPYLLTGQADDMAEQILRLRDRWGITYVVIQRSFEELAPVIPLLQE